MRIFTRAELERTIDFPEILKWIEEGFVLYSQGQAVIPPAALLHFDRGECHIKYGYATGGRYYVVKIASNFALNPQNGLPAGNGLILLFDLATGAPVALFQDEGYLTDLRTAVAGAIAAKYLAPKHISCVGIVGTGAQAFYQLSAISQIIDCKRFMIWGRSSQRAQDLAERFSFGVEVASDLDQLCAACNLIVTTTSARSPLLFPEQIAPGTHITAIGADDVGKVELAPSLLEKADCLIGDSELGAVIADPSKGRTAENQITIAQLKGVAIQDLQIARYFLKL